MKPSASQPPHPTWRFGPFDFDPRIRELRKYGIRIKLQEQPGRVLAALLETPGQVVTRAELQRRLWPNGTIVDFEQSLNKAVNKIRQVLPDSADHPIYIETLPRLGYRFLAPVERIEPPGTAAHYRILGEAGRGAMGVVYRAEDLRLRRRVALKFLPEGLADDALALERFRREAQALAALNHPGICTLYGLEEEEGGPCLVMEYVEGRPLNRLIEGQPLNRVRMLEIALQVAGALVAAHDAGVVHRDLKPANIMVGDDGRVKVLDFGLAKLIERGRTDEAGPQTEKGLIVGTAGYMSPEQAKGNPAEPRSDIFSFGSVLYEMTTGRQAFQRDSELSTIAAILHEEPRAVRSLKPDAPAGLERIIHRCLRKAPDDRFPNMTEVRSALEQIQDEPGRGAPAPRRTPVWTAALLALVAAVGFGAWFDLIRPPATESPARVTALTAIRGIQTEPALSPDGKQVAFVRKGDEEDNYHIYVQLVGDVTPRRLTTDPAFESSPAWSPDALHIAFLRETSAGTEVIVIPAAGGVEKRLHVSAASCGPGLTRLVYCGLAWAPNGKFLTFVDVDKESPEPRNSIFLLDIETREKRQLTKPPPGFQDGRSAFSPDGQSLAFTRLPGLPLSEIYVLPLSDNGQPRAEPRRITYDDSFIYGLDWTRDGRNIVFGSSRGGIYALWRVASSGGVPERLSVGSNDALWPSVSRRADRLAFKEGALDPHVWRVAAPGSGATGTAAAPIRITQSPRSDQQPVFSPDSRKIAWVSMHSGTHQIWVSDVDGSHPTRLTDLGPPGADSPQWSPDGRQIAFRGFGGGRHVYVIDAEGGVPRRLTSGDFIEEPPTWSRDGKWVYFTSNRGEGEALWRVPAGGGSPTLLEAQVGISSRHLPAGAGAPKFKTWEMARSGREPFESPDGKYVYYGGPEKSIWKVPPGGGMPILVVRRGWPPVVESPDRQFIYYAGPNDSIWKVPAAGGEAVRVLRTGQRAFWTATTAGIYILDPDAEGGPEIKLVPFRGKRSQVVRLPGRPEGFVEPTRGFAASPDGRWIAYLYRERRDTEIMLVENFR